MRGIGMDDLDHSIHISEYDWTSFYEDSEDCVLLQPSLARPDNSNLSDSEDSENSSSVVSADQQETQQSNHASSDGAESNTAGRSTEEESRTGRVKLNQSGTRGQPGDEDSVRRADCEICLERSGGHSTEDVKTAGDATEETSDSVPNTLQTGPLNVQCSGESEEELTKDEDVRTESALKSSKEPDPVSCIQTEPNVNELHTTERAASEDVSSVASRAEKERWFVTVNDPSARQRGRATSVKKKRRQKKPCEGSRRCRARQETAREHVVEFEMYEDNNESEGGGDTQSNQKSGGHPRAETNTESSQVKVVSGSTQMSGEGHRSDDVTESSTDGSSCEPGGSASTSQDTLTPPRLESVESDELEDSAEFCSIHSCDSESYLSAAESVEDHQRDLKSQQWHCSLPLTSDSHPFNLTENTDYIQDEQMLSCHGTVSRNVAATNCEGYESTSGEPSLIFPSAGQRATEMPDDNSACDNDSHSTVFCMPSDTPGPHEHTMNVPASGCSGGDQLGPLPVPDLTVTPCSVADSPETYAQAAGSTRPVYAISAFWDEMEKLTINDILRLRMGRSPPPRETQETATPDVKDSPTTHCSLVDTAEYSLSDSALMDASDAADSDYFTQPDESKPDCSSFEFSTSDFEEEYWQFLGASRNPSPDPDSKHQPRTSHSPSLSREEESMSSEGRETPVPLEDPAGQCFDDEGSHTLTLGELEWPRRITKSKSMRNVQALNTEGLSFPSVLGNDDSGLFLSRCQSLEENTVLTLSDSLEIPAPFLSNTDLLDAHYQISFPGVFESFFTEAKANTTSPCVTVYDPEDISVAPVLDYTLCAFTDEASSSSLQCSKEQPIPIFSCSHPTVRELTFPKPNYVFLSSNCGGVEDISPIRVVSHSFIQAGPHGPSAAGVGGSPSWKSLLSVRKIRFHDKGSIWCNTSGAWLFPVEAEKISIRTEDPAVTVVSEGSICPVSSQLFRELEEQQRILETMQTTKREGIFSTLKQSDMCLVCIAFASWVLTSSDPEAADAWKAALLANVSALSAIQYLRHYVKKKNPLRDEP